jgi:hypothetical protein
MKFILSIFFSIREKSRKSPGLWTKSFFYYYYLLSFFSLPLYPIGIDLSQHEEFGR